MIEIFQSTLFKSFGTDGEIYLDWDDEVVEIACSPTTDRIYVDISNLMELINSLDSIRKEIESKNPYLLVPPIDEKDR